MTVYAESDIYKLGEKSKDYTVSGLNELLTDLSQLGDKTKEYIHGQAESCGDDFADNDDYGGSYTCTTEPACMYLLTNEDGENLLFDVHKATFSKNGASCDYYWCCKFKDVYVNENNNLSPATYSEKKIIGNYDSVQSDGSEFGGTFNYYCGSHCCFRQLEDCENFIRENYTEMTNISKYPN